MSMISLIPFGERFASNVYYSLNIVIFKLKSFKSPFELWKGKEAICVMCESILCGQQ